MPATSTQITIPSGAVASNLTGFVVRVDLADLPLSWWDSITADGIRVESATPAMLPVDVIAADQATKTGELYFKADLLAASDNVFTISHDSTRSAIAASDSIGRYAVWAGYDAVLINSASNRADGFGVASEGNGVITTGYMPTVVSPPLTAHQGVAVDDDHFYVIHTNSVAKYTRDDWTLVDSDSDLLATAGLSSPYNHIGDGFVHDGLLYVTASSYPRGSTAESIVVLDADDLSFVAKYDVSATGHQLASLCTDGDYIYSVGYNAGTNYTTSIQRWTFAGVHDGTLTIPTTNNMQGISWDGTDFWISAGGSTDILYRWDGTTRTAIWDFKEFYSVGGSPELEGLDWHDGRLFVLHMHNVSADASYLYEMVPTDGLAFDGTGYIRLTVPIRTSWTMATTVELTSPLRRNNSVISVDRYQWGSNTHRATLVADYDSGGDRWGLWNSTDQWLHASSPIPVPGGRRRVQQVQSGISYRSLGIDGVVTTDSGVAQRPSTEDHRFVIGAGRATTTISDWTPESLLGNCWRAYFRDGAMSEDWLAAEFASWETPAEFYEVEVDVPTGTATLSATTGGSVTLGVILPGYTAEATLTATSGGSAALEVGPFSAFASLTATTGGAATIGGAAIPPAVALTATTDGSATLGAGSGVYAALALTATTGGSAALGITVTATAAIAVSTSGSAWLARAWTPDPVTGRGAFALTVTDRAGTPLASLDSSYITRAIVDRLNDVDGTGSGTAFTVPDEATDTHASLRQYRELQVARGGHHLGTYVLLNPDDIGTASSVSWQAAGLGHYFTKRRIGPAVRPGLLPKRWRAGFREGSIPPAPPKWSRPGTPALVGPALRVEGSTYVQRTVTRLGADTTFAFGSYVLTGTGKDALRAFADEVVVDTDLNDLVDIEPPTVTIEGHTDNVPYTSHPGGNQWLSEQRANAVRDFLAPLVPEGTTLIAVGYGATRPVASNATSAGRQANRRVDLTYPKTESARGHRQYLQDSLTYTNPSAHIKRVLTFVSWWSLESYKEPNADGSVIWLGRRPVGSTDDDAWTEADWVDIDDETPLNTWTRSEVSITVPADGQAWEIVARLTPPAGTIVYDEGATELYADDALEFIDVDQALIVKGLVEHAQDPAFDKDDLGIATDTPLTGIKRTRVYYWHERATISDCLEELVNVAGGMDLTWQTTPMTRTLVSHYPRAGQVTSASLHAGEDRTVDDYQISLNGAAAATSVIVQADGSGADREEGVAQGVPDDLDLVLEDVWTAEPGTHIGELNNQAARGHRNYGGHVPILTATVRQEQTDEWLDRVHLGDVITVDLPARVRHVTGPHRVTARSLDPITDRVIVSPTVEV